MTDAVSSPAVRKVPCPSCRQPALYGAANPWRPFCSARCRSADLGAWASERFRMPAEAPADTRPDASMDTSLDAPTQDSPLRKGH